MRVNSAAMAGSSARGNSSGQSRSDDVSVMTHAELTEAELAQRFFALFHRAHASCVTGRPYSMREESRRPPACPHTRICCACQFADIGFVSPASSNGAQTHCCFAALCPATEVALVIHIHT